MKLNKDEQRILNELVLEGIQNNGARTASELINDNVTWFDETDIQRLGYTKFQAAGYMSSLQQKNLIVNNDEFAKFGWTVTDDGIKLAFADMGF